MAARTVMHIDENTRETISFDERVPLWQIRVVAAHTAVNDIMQIRPVVSVTLVRMLPSSGCSSIPYRRSTET